MRPGESGTVHSRLPGPGGSGYPVDRLVDRPSRPGCAGERKFPSGGSVPRIFCRLANQDPNGSHPFTRSLQAIPIQRTPAGVCRLDEPGNYFPPALRAKKFTPALPGHAEEISLKIIPGTPDPVLWLELPLSVIFVIHHKDRSFVDPGQPAYIQTPAGNVRIRKALKATCKGMTPVL